MRKNLRIYLITSCLTLSPLTAAAADLASYLSATLQQASKMETSAEQLADGAHDLKKLCKAAQRSAPTPSLDTILQQASKIQAFAERVADGTHDLQKVWKAVQTHAASTLISAPDAADTRPAFETTMRSYFEKTEQHTELTQQKAALEQIIASLSEKLGVLEADQLSFSEILKRETATVPDREVVETEYDHVSSEILKTRTLLDTKKAHLRDIDARLSAVNLELGEYRELAEEWNSKLLLDQLKVAKTVAKSYLSEHSKALQELQISWTSLMLDYFNALKKLEPFDETLDLLDENDTEYVTIRRNLYKALKLIQILTGWEEIAQTHLRLESASSASAAASSDLIAPQQALKVLEFLLPNLQQRPTSFSASALKAALNYIHKYREQEKNHDKMLILRDAQAGDVVVIEEIQEELHHTTTALESLLPRYTARRETLDALSEKQKKLSDEVVLKESLGASVMDAAAHLGEVAILNQELARITEEYETENIRFSASPEAVEYKSLISHQQGLEAELATLQVRLEEHTEEIKALEASMTANRLALKQVEASLEKENYFGLPAPIARARFALHTSDADADDDTDIDSEEEELAVDAYDASSEEEEESVSDSD